MTFAQPLVLWGLIGPALAAVTLVVLAVLRRRRSWTRWPGITRVVAVGTQVHPVGVARGTRRPWLLLLALTLALVALAGPRWGTIEEPVYQRSREVMLALDLSRSMLVQDVLPSRLERSRLLVRSMLEGLRGERVGLIVFAGTAFVQVPMSTDYQILEEFLTELNPEYMPQGGTDYDGMLRAALGGFSTTADTDRYLIVLSDGEAQDEAWRGQMPALKERGIHVIGLGVGTVAGGFIPDPKTGAFVKDARGAVVLSKLEPDTLQSLAADTAGTYRDASAWVDLAAVLQETVERGRQGQFTEQRAARAIERFQWFLAPALLCALLGVWREIPIRPRARQVRPAVGSSSRGRVGRTASTVAAVVFAGMFLLTPTRSDAAVEDKTPASATDKLRATITRLAAADTIAPAGWKAMAEQTLALGQETLQSQQPLEPGLVYDGIAAVDAGERLDPRAADWAKLRDDLQRLLEPPPQQQQQDKQQSEEKQDNEEQQDQQQQQQQDQQQQSGQQDDKQQQQESQDQSDEQQQQQKQQDKQSPGQDQPQQAQKEDSGFDQEPRQEQPEPSPNQQPQDQQQQAASETPKTRKFGGQQDARQKQSQENPELAAALSRLEQVQENDSPARLHQRLEEQARREERQGPAPANPRDW